MPRAASRITLKITGVRVERLQSISDRNAIAEGAPDHLKADDLNRMKHIDPSYKIPSPFTQHQFGFMGLWCKINGVQSWVDNPWVWVVEFKKIANAPVNK